jgi:hypothetical protein
MINKCCVSGCECKVDRYLTAAGSKNFLQCQKHRKQLPRKARTIELLPNKNEVQYLDGRPLCMVEGCDRLAIKKKNGYFRKVCGFHGRSWHQHDARRIRKNANARLRRAKKGGVENKVCSQCNWEGACDRHRILPGSQGGKYVKNNLQILCPNCHRASHGRGQVNQKQIYSSSTPITSP